jgi:hypothetical protein
VAISLSLLGLLMCLCAALWQGGDSVCCVRRSQLGLGRQLHGKLHALRVFGPVSSSSLSLLTSQASSMLLHFCLVAMFCWMLLEGCVLYNDFVIVVGVSIDNDQLYKMGRYAAYGLPLLIVIVGAAVDREDYYTNRVSALCALMALPRSRMDVFLFVLDSTAGSTSSRR